MITFRNVSLKYNNSDNYALKNINLKIEEGEFVFIVGATGAGKTSLFKLLTREMSQDAGTIKVFDQDISMIRRRDIPYYRRNLGIIFQDFKLLNDKTAYQNISFAQEVVGANRFKIKKRCLKVMNLVGIREKARKYPDNLSGGEKQKVAIARALVNRPAIILADEPTGNLDEISTNEVMFLLQKINELGTTVVVITHDLHMVSRFQKRVIRLKNGVLYSDTIGLDEELQDYLETEKENNI